MKSRLTLTITIIIFHQFLQAQNDPTKLVEKITDNTYRIDNILINTTTKTLEFPAWVNMTEGLVEVMVCAPGGKDHESVFIANVVPSYLNSALLLLGLETDKDLNYDPRTPNIIGPSLNIFVEWEVDGDLFRIPAENTLINITDSSTVDNINWVYTGSFSKSGHYAADNVKSIITTYNDLTTIIDNGSKSGIDDTLFEANPKVLPPKRTDVKILIQLNKE
ncbi:MAG: YdjY domain-containing protein [Melioribacteraceae bacterium]|nr:YdjY domain-containing protein [Melioribacteraceae bacterium]WKZ70810.1 MAG: YdjY domain-containing protein [Melioribacteraceae bacterium]